MPGDCPWPVVRGPLLCRSKASSGKNPFHPQIAEAFLKILLLTLPHSAAHQRASKALRAALLETRPGTAVEVVDALSRCTPWFRAYYNSYQIPLRYWPSLWGWSDSPVLLVLLGGTGFGNPRLILSELGKLRRPLQVVVIRGRNVRMEKDARALCESRPRSKVLGWVDNMREWMVAADLMVSKPGGHAGRGICLWPAHAGHRPLAGE
jgi:hypothetical protein